MFSCIVLDSILEIIDDLKELSQFVGSSGQCLIAFANAKKCATFLQDNRFIVAKTHTKVILLTPTEIPAKTLVKFTKIGLTESILENSPTKTLLYKVKLLLRSIKTSSGGENQELAVKTIGEAAATQAQAKGEINAEKLQTEEEASVNYLADEQAKFKKNDQDNTKAINYGESLEGKTSAQEESIDTHWKSKRKKDDLSNGEDEKDFSKVQVEDSAEQDMYYRGKKKTNELDIIKSDQMQSRKKMDESTDTGEDLYGKILNSTDLDLAPAEAEKRKKLRDEVEAGYELKQSKKTFELEAADDEPERRQFTEEDEEERKRKELLELDALFEEAKKRQLDREAEDLGGHYRGKITNSAIDLEDPEATQEHDKYDNSDLYKKEKPLDLELVPVRDDKRRGMNKEEEVNKEKERKGFGEKIDSNMSSGGGQTDHIETLMMSDVGRERIKKAQMMSEEKEKTKQEKNEDIEERSRNSALDPATAESPSLRKKIEKEEVPSEQKEKSLDLDFAAGDDDDRKREKRLDQEEYSSGRRAQTKLKLVEEDRGDRAGARDEDDDKISQRKLDTSEREETKKKDLTANEKKDSFHRGGEAKKKDQDWDVNERKNNIDLGLEKTAKSGPDNIQKKDLKDLGEQTIDYRQMKVEFEAIFRGESIYDEESGQGAAARHGARDHEDDSFKVVDLDAAGFDFAINVLNMIYQKEIMPEEFFKLISEELNTRYHAYPVFYSYKASDQKNIEVYDFITKMPLNNSNREFKTWWSAHKKEEIIFNDVASKTMLTWVCRELNWEDVELPSWAANELTNKKVELVFPYYDGVDRMGMAVLYFPNGLNPKDARGLEVTLEMARTIMLDTIQRKAVPSHRRDEVEENESQETTEKKNILNVFSGFFKGKKVGE